MKTTAMFHDLALTARKSLLSRALKQAGSYAILLILSIGWASLAIAQPLIIDGRLNDPLWRNVPRVRLTPSQTGTPSDLGGEVQVIVAGRYLHVAAKLPEPTG